MNQSGYVLWFQSRFLKLSNNRWFFKTQHQSIFYIHFIDYFYSQVENRAVNLRCAHLLQKAVVLFLTFKKVIAFEKS